MEQVRPIHRRVVVHWWGKFLRTFHVECGAAFSRHLHNNAGILFDFEGIGVFRVARVVRIVRLFRGAKGLQTLVNTSM